MFLRALISLLMLTVVAGCAEPPPYANLDNEGLKQLAALTELKALWLTGTDITDDGIVHLCRLKQLEELDVANTRVTASGLRTLQQSLEQLQSLQPKP